MRRRRRRTITTTKLSKIKTTLPLSQTRSYISLFRRHNDADILVGFDAHFLVELSLGFGIVFENGVTGVDGDALPFPPFAQMLFTIGENAIFFFRAHCVTLTLDGALTLLAC